jgi:uncharacterized protein YbjT (DUF2867 family)
MHSKKGHRMEKNLYTIMGATGNIGHVIAQNLLMNGHQVRAIGRNPKKLAHLKTLGAETFSLENFDDADRLKEAFHKADAVFCLIPPSIFVEDEGAYQDDVGEAIKTALKKSKNPYIVNLSSFGAQIPEGTGPIAGLHRQEKRLNSLSGVNILHLRPGYFMENLLTGISSIKNTGAFCYSLRGNIPMEMVATIDIGKKAAELLHRLDFTKQTVFEFIGPREVSFNEAIPILGKAIGKPDLKYVEVSYDETDKAMLSIGMQPKTVSLFREMNTAFNEERIKLTQRMTPDHRGKTTIGDFANEFARAYK